MIESLFDNEYNIKDKIVELKKYAEKHTALFTASISGILTVSLFYIYTLYIVYRIGELYCFKVESFYAFNFDKNNIIIKIIIYISVTSIFLLTNLLGYFTYLKRSFLKYFFALIAFLFILLSCFCIAISSLKDVLNEVSKLIPLILIYSIAFTIALTSYSISFIIKPSLRSKVIRLESKKDKYKKKLENIKLNPKKQNKISKKLEKTNEKSRKLVNKNKSTKNDESDIKKTNNSDIAIYFVLAISILGVLIVSFAALGFSYSAHKTQYDLISTDAVNKIEIDIPDSLNNTDANNYVVILQNEDYIIVSPCCTNGDNIKIYTDYHLKLENTNIFQCAQKYKNVEIQ